MGKIDCKRVVILITLVISLTTSAKAEKTNHSGFLINCELYKEGTNHFTGTKYLNLSFGIIDQKTWGKQFYTARLKKAIASDSYYWGLQLVSSYYEMGEPVGKNKPTYIEMAIQFLERHPIRFSFKDDQLVVENEDSLQTAFSEEVKIIYPKEDLPGHGDVFFSLKNLLNVFQLMQISFPEDLQKPEDMSLKKGVVYNYLDDDGRLRHVEITDTKNHTKSNVYFPKGSNQAKFISIQGILGQTIIRISDPNEKQTMRLSGILANQKNKTLEFDIEGASLLDPARKVEVKIGDDGKFNLTLDQVFPVTISSLSGLQFYLEPGDDISFRSNLRGDSLSFSGIGAGNNQFIQEEMKLKSFPKEDFQVKNAQTQAIWFGKADKVTNERFVLLENYKTILSPRFYESKFVNYYFGKINRKLDYMFSWFENSDWGIIRRKYQGLDTIPDSYQSFVFNRELSKYQGKRLLLQFEGLRNFTQISSYNSEKSPTQTEMLRLATLTYSGKILRDYLEFEASSIYNSNNSIDIKTFQALVSECFDNTEFQSKIFGLNANANLLENGNLFPSVGFKDMKGTEIKLSQFLGSAIYLMFWRNDALLIDKQWNEFQQLMDKMKGKKVLFVSVGMEEDFLRWKKYVETMKMSGLNLFIDRNGEAFKKNFPNLKSRHFLLIDSNGQIVNNNGPDPSVASVLISQNIVSPNLDGMLIGVLIFFVSILLILGLVWSISHTRQKRKAKIEMLLNRLRETELKAIKAQMNPHFLFNSLNSIQNLINQKNIEAANMYLSKFARLLRAVLQHSEKEFVPIADEIETIKLYVQLEKLRFDFDFQLNIAPELDVYNTYIPPLLLQPFIENAILHGLQPKHGYKNLSIWVEEHAKQVFCRIADNGVGRSVTENETTNHHGIGNKLSIERINLLNQKNNSNFKLDIEDGKTGESGTLVTISFTNNLL
jgi:hypothetical protein